MQLCSSPQNGRGVEGRALAVILAAARKPAAATLAGGWSEVRGGEET
jgi:hypothetical protein